MIALSAPAATMVALRAAMRPQGVGNTAPAERRLLDLDHCSQIGQNETALLALGQRLAIATRAAWTWPGSHTEGVDGGQSGADEAEPRRLH